MNRPSTARKTLRRIVWGGSAAVILWSVVLAWRIAAYGGRHDPARADVAIVLGAAVHGAEPSPARAAYPWPNRSLLASGNDADQRATLAPPLRGNAQQPPSERGQTSAEGSSASARVEITSRLSCVLVPGVITFSLTLLGCPRSRGRA